MTARLALDILSPFSNFDFPFLPKEGCGPWKSIGEQLYLQPNGSFLKID